ncbi:MAG: methionine adenosyltransferase [Chitinophagales bacterium]|nr:methionine adenosyltransferase [Chitinophagales bacterium]MDW8427919.1 methionine adenosyltransferase [Chitinophagales bacterium]
MPYLFTSESVSEGHPDKIADQISDAVLDSMLLQDRNAKVACEVFVTTGLAIIGGEIRTKAYVDLQKVVRGVIQRIGYTRAEYQFDANSCGVINVIHEQSDDIYRGVKRGRLADQGAGDQGMMFGYACSETENFMPLPIELAHALLRELAAIRKEGRLMTYLRPDSKSQVTIEYDDNNQPLRIDTIVLSTQHDEFIQPKSSSLASRRLAEEKMVERIRDDVLNILIPRVKRRFPSRIRRLFDDRIKYHINPTGKFVIGGPHGDTGLTGRKIIVDTYGGRGAHGGGAFSGKDPSKVDRSAAYALRHVAKNMVAAGICSEVLVQVAYAIGIAEPVGLYVNTYGTARVHDASGNIMSDAAIAKKISEIFDLRPGMIIKRLGLLNPIYSETAAYGHMGRTPCVKVINGKEYECFTWEKLDYVDKLRRAFRLT